MTAQHPPTVDLGPVRDLVDRAIRAAVAPGNLVEKPLFLGAQTITARPTPLAGLQAALEVANLAQDRAHKFAVDLRGDGKSWLEVADLLEIPWSEEYRREERAYELVGGAGRVRRGAYAEPRVSWYCGGPLGCGEFVTDRGPYNGAPVDNEDGHADGCRRLVAETAAHDKWLEEEEDRTEIMYRSGPLVTDPFGKETVKRVQYVQQHGGRYLGWSTSETLAVALVLNDPAGLNREGYTTWTAAIERVFNSSPERIKEAPAWIRRVRAAATGLTK
jgi:hypothetical protein